MAGIERVAVVVPRVASGPFMPLLDYPALAAEARGAEIRRISWEAPGGLQTDPDTKGPWVVGQVGPVLDSVLTEFPGSTPLLIGSSLGSRAAALASDRALPAIWVTPPLTADQWVGDALRRTGAPCLLIGGTADPLWDGELARRLSPHVLEIDGADHAMLVPGPLANSATILGHIATAVEQFLDDIVWPP